MLKGDMKGKRRNVSRVEVKGEFFSIAWPICPPRNNNIMAQERESQEKHVCGCMLVSKGMLDLSHLTFPPPTPVLLTRVCMLQGHSLIWHFIHIQISSLIYTTFSSTSVINGSFCKASAWLLGNKQCKSRGEMFADGSLTMAAGACRWRKKQKIWDE